MVTENLGEAFGQERVVRIAAEGLRAKGHEIYFLSAQRLGPSPPSHGELLIEGLFSLHNLSPKKKITASVQAVKRFVSRTDPHVIHFMDQLHPVIAKELIQHYPSVFTAHSVAPTCPASQRLIYPQGVCSQKSGWSCLLHHRSYQCLSGFKSDLHRGHAVLNFLQKKKLYQRVAAVGAISEYVQQTLVRDGWPKEQVPLIYNPVEMPQAISSSVNVPHPLIVSACRLVPLKGVDHVLEALAKNADLPWTYWVFGTGPMEARWKALSAELGIEKRVIFQGRASFENLQSVTAKASLFVQANLGPEGFGLSVAEASALGVPVISYDQPALNEVIAHNENGFLVSPGDIPGLGHGIRQILMDPSLGQRLGDRGPALIQKRFSCDKYIRQTLELYEIALRAKKKNAA